jgi:hypothetical protein
MFSSTAGPVCVFPSAREGEAAFRNPLRIRPTETNTTASLLIGFALRATLSQGATVCQVRCGPEATRSAFSNPEVLGAFVATKRSPRPAVSTIAVVEGDNGVR